MKTKNKVLAGIAGAVAVIGGVFATKHAIDEATSPENILNKVKTELSQLGSVGSSWISSEKELWHDQKVYTGVVKISDDKGTYNLEFKAGVSNGEIISMEKI